MILLFLKVMAVPLVISIIGTLFILANAAGIESRIRELEAELKQKGEDNYVL